MSANPKIVVRFNLWCDPALGERLACEADIELRICDLEKPDTSAWCDLAAAHVYHISSAKDELPRRWFVTAELLEKCPKLLCVSTSGAGYDTVDVAACTRAGVIVVNQSGGNAQAVAEHAIGMMLGVSKRIGESDHRLRRARFCPRRADGAGYFRQGSRTCRHRSRRHARRTPRERFRHDRSCLRSLSLRGRNRPPRRALGDDGRTARAVGFRVDPLSAHSETLGMIDARAFARMKKGAVFVTTVRGGIHDEGALFVALQSAICAAPASMSGRRSRRRLSIRCSR
jgi:D-3-phosphoglycerate dehydrogenase